jgi:putative ABC transport system permease protein
MILSIIGCLIGLLFSWVALRVIYIIANSSFGVSITVAVVAVIFSMGVGVLFGIYPANKAAKMRPIDALRFN